MQVVDISRKFVGLHAQYTNDIMDALALAASPEARPVNPPVFFAFTYPLSGDPEAFTIDDGELSFI